MANIVERTPRTSRRNDTGDSPADSRRPAVMAASALLVAFVAATGVLCFLGTFTRPAADDFRFIVLERRDGVFGPAEYLYTTLTGRVGNGLFAGLVYLSPEWGLKLTPVVALLALALAATLLTRAVLGRSWGGHTHPLAAPLAGLGTAVLALATQPRSYDTLYWPAGAITYTFPPALVTGLIAVALLARSRRARLWTGVAAMPLGVLLGATSGTISAAVLILLVLAGVGHLLFVRRPTRLPAAGVLFGASTMAGAVIVLTSPGHARSLRLRPHGEPLFGGRVMADSVASTHQALAHLATDMALPAAAAVGVLVCLLARPHRPLPAGRLLFALVAGAAGVLALTFAVMWELRVGWGHDGWTFYRAWFVFRYAAVLVAAFYGFAAADIVRRMRFQADGPRTVACAVCLALVAAAFTGHAARLQSMARSMADRATAFDDQTARVERAGRAGARTAVIGPLPIEELAVPFVHGRPSPWATAYYGLTPARATPARATPTRPTPTRPAPARPTPARPTPVRPAGGR
ncbi:DUF6056 family protein [Actinomadura harenae]|uniref:Uncharacterized protein n=1 Tax=Actinomadura harenae TaxID=2483351 RepID=A0A3M2M5Z4_9ACTN|nr:DUF6056 family protein [Actinomadura harenae]RMI45097.1 hypothetical protein EBO15_11050 [Actinomadura harenae]